MPKEKQADGPAYPISSVDNALRLLLMFREQPQVRVADASAALGVGRSTAHRLLAMLQHHDFVEQDPATRAYRSGPALVEIGLAVVRGMDVRTHLRPFLEQLSREVDETTQLIVLQGAEALFVDSVETGRALKVGGRVGATLPAHCASGGKALLAALSPARVRELYPRERLVGVTPRSIVSRSALEAELERVRADGYAVNDGESEPDVVALGAVVRDAHGAAHAAIAISAPTSRTGARRRAALADALLATTAAAGARLP